MTKPIDAATRKAMANALYQEIYNSISSSLDATRIHEGIVIRLDNTDLVINVTVKKEQLDLQKEIALYAKKEVIEKEKNKAEKENSARLRATQRQAEKRRQVAEQERAKLDSVDEDEVDDDCSCDDDNCKCSWQARLWNERQRQNAQCTCATCSK